MNEKYMICKNMNAVEQCRRHHVMNKKYLGRGMSR